jgi:hypothetical protein
MSGQYEKPLTIKEAINAIQSNDFYYLQFKENSFGQAIRFVSYLIRS